MPTSPDKNHTTAVTPHNDVNTVLAMLTAGLIEVLGDQLVGFYLTGSLTYGDFDRGSSDIDVIAILTEPLSDEQITQITALHAKVAEQFPEWAKRIEANYVTKAMLSSTLPPKEFRPYFNGGKFWNFQYGNEWLLNLHVLRDCGVALVGPDPKELLPPIDIAAVREASKRDLHADWEPKLSSGHPFESPGYDTNHLQAYAVLTMCRILHRAKNDEVASKRVASAWSKHTYPEWKSLIDKAENWQHGKQMNAAQEALDFIRFTVMQAG